MDYILSSWYIELLTAILFVIYMNWVSLEKLVKIRFIQALLSVLKKTKEV
jgi:hypothetical protein